MKWVTRDQMREIDRRAIEDFGLPAIVLMENAGHGCAREAEALYRQRGLHGPVLVFCGGGNNGGDGFVVARHLSNAGFDVRVLCCGGRGQVNRQGEAGVNLTVCERMGLPITDLDTAQTARAAGQLPSGALIVDAIFGIGLSSAPRAPHATVIRRLADSGLPVVAVDVPSGLDADTGLPLGVCLRADVTATMACPKVGLRGPGQAYVGRLVVVDIGLPASLVRE